MTAPCSAGVERKGAAAVSGTLGVLSWQPSPMAMVQLSSGEVYKACSAVIPVKISFTFTKYKSFAVWQEVYLAVWVLAAARRATTGCPGSLPSTWTGTRP